MRKKLMQGILSVGDYTLFVFNVIRIAFLHRLRWELIREQMFNIGVLSLPVVAFTGFSTGMVLAAQSIFQLSDKGLASATGLMVGKAMLTELGPVLTAFMVTGRIGAAMCAELGSMKVTEQIDALRSMAVHPYQYLVGPRFLAGMAMMPFLTVFSSIMGIFGGYLMAVHYYGMTPASYFDPMPIHVTTFDFFSGMVKAFVFGMFIVTISCYKGMRTTGGAAGVGSYTTNSVVICYSVILITNFLLTLGMNSAHGYLLNTWIGRFL
jgi:phospholipid/cholesterol/gamma-HCH transport system permease protein